MNEIPKLGFGLFQLSKEQTAYALQMALVAGFQHIDCAFHYGNEIEAGPVLNKFIENNGRKKLWITSKLPNIRHKPSTVEKTCRQQLHDLELDYFDLYLIHWPMAFIDNGSDTFPKDEFGKLMFDYDSAISLEQTWEQMERLVYLGLSKRIGVSNFPISLLLDLLNYCNIKPYVNQVESHPYFQNTELINFCFQHKINITGYSSLGGSYDGHNLSLELLSHPTIRRLEKQYRRTPAQIVLRWHFQRHDNYSFLVKSSKPDRIFENSKILYFELDDDAMMQIDMLEQGLRMNNPSLRFNYPLFD